MISNNTNSDAKEDLGSYLTVILSESVWVLSHEPYYKASETFEIYLAPGRQYHVGCSDGTRLLLSGSADKPAMTIINKGSLFSSISLKGTVIFDDTLVWVVAGEEPE